MGLEMNRIFFRNIKSYNFKHRTCNKENGTRTPRSTTYAVTVPWNVASSFLQPRAHWQPQREISSDALISQTHLHHSHLLKTRIEHIMHMFERNCRDSATLMRLNFCFTKPQKPFKPSSCKVEVISILLHLH